MIQKRNTILRSLFIIAGTLSLIFGVVGIILPLLPTTPFLLLAAACYARGSNKFYNWLLENKLFGEYIKKYRKGEGIPVKIIIVSIILLWATITYSIIIITHLTIIRVILLGIALSITAYIISLKNNQLNKMPSQ